MRNVENTNFQIDIEKKHFLSGMHYVNLLYQVKGDSDENKDILQLVTGYKKGES